MQKKKLDLNNLLAKYQGYSNYESNQNSRYIQTAKQPRIQEEFYQNKTYQAPSNDKYQDYNKSYQQKIPKSFQGTFTMSKSQVQQFLLGIKDELRREQKSISLNSEQVIRQIHEDFQKSHDRLKKQIIQLLDKAFYQNQRAIKEQLSRQSKAQFPDFVKIYNKIGFINSDIDRLLNALKGSQYKQAIAQAITKDFQIEMNELKASMTVAKSNYLHSLGQIQPDRSRIQNIKDNLSKLFYFTKKKPQIQQQEPHIVIKEESSIFNIFKDKSAPPKNTAYQNPQSQSRTRKSFFNFGGQ